MKPSFRKSFAVLVAGISALGWSVAAVAASTTSYQVAVQTRVDASAPLEVYLASFASLDDLFAGTIGAPTGFTEIEITPDFEIAGLTWDGTAYRVLVESRADSAAPLEVYLASFATLDDLFAADIGTPTGFTEIEITPDFKIAGLTWDGTAYRVLVQSRADSAAPLEVYLASFATLDDLFAATIGTPTGFTEIEITPDFRIADFTWDGSAYRMLAESRADAVSPFEVYLASFATLDDLFAATIGTPTGFTEIEIAPGYRIVGFSSVTTVTPVPGIPEPATWGLMITGIGGVGVAMRRRRRAITA